MERTWTQQEVDGIKEEVSKLEGLPEGQRQAGLADIERRYGLTPGTLGGVKLSQPEELERAIIYQQHYEATMEEVSQMSPAEYERWRSLGSHMKQEVDTQAAAREQARREEIAYLDKLDMEGYAAYKEDLKAKQAEREEAERAAAQQEQKAKLEEIWESIRFKRPEEMTMAEYLLWRQRASE